MSKKYKVLPQQLVKFTDLSGNEIERKMYRLKALRDIPYHNIKEGDLGGWINSKSVLSHEGNCWVGGEAIVSVENWTGVSRIDDNALITGKALIYGVKGSSLSIRQNAIIEDNAKLFVGHLNIKPEIAENARLSENAVAENPVRITGKISGNAKVLSASSVLGSSQVAGDAKVDFGSTILGMARVMGNSTVTNSSTIGENAYITDDAHISQAEIRGTATVSGNARILEQATVCDSATVTDHAVVCKNALVAGRSIVKDAVSIPESTRILGNSIISGAVELNSYKDYMDFISEGNYALPAASKMMALTGVSSLPEENTSDVQELCLKLTGLENEIKAYGNDIVKLLKFPIMSDLRDKNTLEMMMALKNSKNIDPENNPKKFRKSVKSLERKFMKAESNARIICSSAFSDEQRKKAKKARDLFAIACNEVSSEQEKKSAFKQGFRQLEGVVDVTDSAVENMRIKVGIPELEA